MEGNAHRRLLLAGFIVAVSFNLPLFAFAASKYGGCTYGAAAYGGDCNPAPTSSSSSTGGGGLIVGSGPLAPGYQVGSSSPSTTNLTSSSASLTVSSPATTSASTSSVSLNLPHDLQFGMTGGEVRVLQQYLNSHGFPVALSGPGSSGQETSYFGSATQVALAKFQQANGISPAVGYLGPTTRAFIAG